MVSVGPVEVDEISLADMCRQYQVRELALFGSAARGEARADSDIDLLVEFLPEAHIGLMDYAGLMLDLSKLLGRKVDLVSKNGLKPPIRASVLGEMRLLYQTAQAATQSVELPDRKRVAGLQRLQATE